MPTLYAQTQAVVEHEGLVLYTVIAIAVVTTVTILGLTIVSYVSFNKYNRIASEYLTRVFVGGAALRLLTVLAVILSATVLSLAGQLKEGTIALLSGIAGYVLGGIGAETQSGKKARTGGVSGPDTDNASRSASG
jgi:hypothetical protein